LSVSTPDYTQFVMSRSSGWYVSHVWMTCRSC